MTTDTQQSTATSVDNNLNIATRQLGALLTTLGDLVAGVDERQEQASAVLDAARAQFDLAERALLGDSIDAAVLEDAQAGILKVGALLQVLVGVLPSGEKKSDELAALIDAALAKASAVARALDWAARCALAAERDHEPPVPPIVLQVGEERFELSTNGLRAEQAVPAVGPQLATLLAGALGVKAAESVLESSPAPVEIHQPCKRGVESALSDALAALAERRENVGDQWARAFDCMTDAVALLLGWDDGVWANWSLERWQQWERAEATDRAAAAIGALLRLPAHGAARPAGEPGATVDESALDAESAAPADESSPAKAVIRAQRKRVLQALSGVGRALDEPGADVGDAWAWALDCMTDAIALSIGWDANTWETWVREHADAEGGESAAATYRAVAAIGGLLGRDATPTPDHEERRDVSPTDAARAAGARHTATVALARVRAAREASEMSAEDVGSLVGLVRSLTTDTCEVATFEDHGLVASACAARSIVELANADGKGMDGYGVIGLDHLLSQVVKDLGRLVAPASARAGVVRKTLGPAPQQHEDGSICWLSRGACICSSLGAAQPAPAPAPRRVRRGSEYGRNAQRASVPAAAVAAMPEVA